MAGGFQFLVDWVEKLTSGRVSPREAMQLPPMWYGVNKITGHCGRLPLFVKREGKDGMREKATKHWAYDRLLLSPNANQSADIFKQQVTGHAVLWGNGRAVIINKGQQDAEILPLMPDRTSAVMMNGRKWHVTKPEKDDRLPLFKSIEKEGYDGVLVFPDDEVLHIQGFGFDGVEGLSMVGQMRRALGIPISQEEHAYNQTQKGFAAKLMVEAPTGMFTREADAKEWIKQFNDSHSSADNAGKAGLLRNGMKAVVLSMSNDDAQFLEQRKFSRQDVALMLGLDGMPGDGDSHSYNSKEMEALNYLDTGLAPWICKWEMQVDLKILSMADRMNGYYSMFDLHELLRTDSKTQAEIHAIHIANRIKNPNQARYDLGLNPYKGGDTYENPSISPGIAGKPKEDQKSTAESSLQQPKNTEKLVNSALKRLFRREARDAINGANKSDFCGWLDTYYAKWGEKLAEQFRELGLDPLLAESHCKESHEMLLNVAGESTESAIRTNVEACVANWESRADAIANTNEETDKTHELLKSVLNIVTAFASQKPADVNVSVTPSTPNVTVTNEVKIPEQQSPNVTVNNDVIVPEQKTPIVTVTNDVKLPEQKPPIVNVTNDVQPATVDVNLPSRKTTTTVFRDNKGAITGSEQIEEDLGEEE